VPYRTYKCSVPKKLYLYLARYYDVQICCVSICSSQDLERGMSENMMTDYSNGEKFSNLLAVILNLFFKIVVYLSISRRYRIFLFLGAAT
jgi:hypothetical protein